MKYSNLKVLAPFSFYSRVVIWPSRAYTKNGNRQPVYPYFQHLQSIKYQVTSITHLNDKTFDVVFS